jgi:hypothetical protein
LTGAPPRFPEESPVQAMRMVTVLEPGEGGALILPGVVRWGLGLNEGDLLAVEKLKGRLRFHGYAGRLRRLHEAVRHPWPFVEELLRRPMAAVGPAGALTMPEEIAERLRDGAVLRAWVDWGQRGFTLERPEAGRSSPKLWARARYTLPLEPGGRVRLPADALWALSATEAMIAVPESLFGTPWLKPGPQIALILSVSPGGVSFRVELEADLQ